MIITTTAGYALRDLATRHAPDAIDIYALPGGGCCFTPTSSILILRKPLSLVIKDDN